MALAFTHLATDIDDSNLTTYTTASFTSTISRPLFVGVSIADTNPAGTPTLAKTGCTFTLEGAIEYDNAGTRYSLFLFSAAVASTSTGTMTITGTEALAGMGWTVSEVTSHDTSDLVQGSAVTASGSGTALAATLPTFSSANNAGLAVMAVNADGTFTSAGFTILGQDISSTASPVHAIGAEWKANTTAMTATGPSGLWGMIAVEVRAVPVLTEIPAYPTLVTSIAWGNGPKDASPTWTVIPSGLVIESHFQSCGRQLDLDQFQGGGGSIVLNNADGRFTPGNAASPYYPNVRFGTPIKQEATVAGTTYTVWRGVIEDTPVEFDPPSRSPCEWPIVDAFADLESQDADYPWRMRIRQTVPKVWLRFEEAAGSTQAIDSSGNAYHGTYVGGPTLEVDFGTSKGATFNGTTQYVTLPLAAAISGTGDFAIEFFADITVSGSTQTVYYQFESATGYQLAVNVLAAGTVQLVTSDSGGSTSVTGASDIATGAEKHIVVRRQGTTHEVLVNGVSDGTTVGTARSISAAAPTVMAAGGSFTTAVTVDEFVTYQQTVSQALAQAHYQAMLAYHALTAGVQIGYVLDSFGWPTADRSIDTGTELVLGQFDPQGSVLDMLRAASDADFGAFYVTPQGILRFRARNTILAAPYTTVQESFGNTGSLMGVVGRSLKLEYQRRRVKNDITLRVNYATSGIATPFTVEVRKQDATSVGLYGAQAWSKDVLTVAAGGTAPIAARLGTLIDWTLAHYKDPIREVRELELHPSANSTLGYWLQVLQRTQEDRISHAHTAPGGEVISGEYHIQRVSHDIGPGKQWQTTWTISPADTTAYWVWGTATWDVSTRWAP